MQLIKNIGLLLCILASVNVSAADKIKTHILNSIERFAKDHKIQAVYALSAKGKMIVNGAQGFYDLEGNARLNVSQIMSILSITKQFTATGILLLQDRGLLSTNDTVAKLLPASSGVWPDDKLPKWAYRVTIHHLLTHSSGIAEYIWNVTFDAKQTLKESKKAVIGFAASRPVAFEPGSQYKYNHTGYMLLGVIIEHLAEQNLGEFFKKEFFKPLKMNNTSLLSLEEAIKLQKGLLYNKYPLRYLAIPSSTTPKFTQVISTDLYAPYGDGGAVSNAEDLIKWNNALHHNKILSKKSYHQMIHPYFKISDRTTGYASHAGYGIFISKLHSGNLYYHHATSTLGTRCDTGYIPKEDMSIAILSNVMLHVPDEMIKKVDFRKPENQIDISYFRDAMLESL